MTTENNTNHAAMLEEGLRQRNAAHPSALTPTDRAKSTMSLTSKMYDVDGDGKLDETEKAMREMDTENRGYLTNEKVYKIMLEQMQLQQEVFGLKRMSLVFLAIVFILSLATLGTSFAAAMLAKDTKLENGNLMSKDGSGVVGTSNVAAVFTVTEDIALVGEDGRRTQEATTKITHDVAGITITMTRNDAVTAHADCAKAGGSVSLERTCGEAIVDIPICSGTTILADIPSGPIYTFTTDQKVTTIDCSDATKPCKVIFPTGTGIDSLGCPLIPKVNLGSAGKYAILAMTGISTVPATVITGDIAVSPVKAAAITGFSLIADATTAFSTSTQIVGKAYASDYAVPIPATLITAVGDMQNAYNDAEGRTSIDDAKIDLGAGLLGIKFGVASAPLTPGVYTFGTGVSIAGDIHFAGSASDIFIIKIEGTMIQAAAKKVILSGGALAQNIFWQVKGAVTVGAGSHMEGIILGKTAVTFITGSTLNGRIFSQTVCALQMATITQPAV
jgi:hypothetical protein